MESPVRTFVIADVRGYSRYTEECGDEAAAELSARFAAVVGEAVDAYEGAFVELRGDEALVVFTSARQAIRAAVELQSHFDEAGAELDTPLRVGIGVDSGEAVQLADGTFRGGALNIAARLCGRASGGEVIISESTARLAGRLGGLHFTDRGRVRLKNIAEPVHIYRVYSELDSRSSNRWLVFIFGKERPGLSWRLGLIVVLIAAATAAAVVYFTVGGGAAPGGAAAPPSVTASRSEPVAATDLASIVPRKLWRDCRVQTVANQRADETAVCVPAKGMPDRWEISRYPNGLSLADAYRSELAKRADIQRDRGKCNAFVWGGERQWEHGIGKPGGRVFCYFDGNDAVIAWTHEQLGQATHKDILVIAREGGSDHAGLTRWWRPWHHQLGKAG